MLSTETLATIGIEKTQLLGMLIPTPRVFEDARGYFLESFNDRNFAEAGIQERFVQGNHSYSVRDVVRGLHYQGKSSAG